MVPRALLILCPSLGLQHLWKELPSLVCSTPIRDPASQAFPGSSQRCLRLLPLASPTPRRLAHPSAGHHNSFGHMWSPEYRQLWTDTYLFAAKWQGIYLTQARWTDHSLAKRAASHPCLLTWQHSELQCLISSGEF